MNRENRNERDQQYTILLVEDNEALRFNTRMMLEMNNYRVISAINGMAALDLLKSMKIPPDIIISDIIMPIMDGYALYQSICKNKLWYQIPFIFLTAKTSPEDVRMGKKLGVDDYIVKPFSSADLLASIEGCVAKIHRNQKMQVKYECSLAEIELQRVKQGKENQIVIFWVEWDKKNGPIIRDSYPLQKDTSIPIRDVGVRLYMTSMAIFDSEESNESSAAFFHINSLGMDAVLLFASVGEPLIREDNRLLMIVVLADFINYLESARIQEKIYKKMDILRNQGIMEIACFWGEVHDILQEQQST
jgi:CheY-like chemotaxis protein